MSKKCLLNVPYFFKKIFFNHMSKKDIRLYHRESNLNLRNVKSSTSSEILLLSLLLSLGIKIFSFFSWRHILVLYFFLSIHSSKAGEEREKETPMISLVGAGI